MNFIFFLILAAFASVPVRAEELTGSSITLRQCYEWANARSGDLKSRREAIAQSDARARSAVGNAFPEAKWEFKDTFQDPDGVEKLEKKGFGGFVQKEQIESDFSVRQPLFSGLKEFSARSGFLRERAGNELRLQRAALELYEATAGAFYTVLGHEMDRENTSMASILANDRVKELRSFLKLGKARDSEVFTAQARASALIAQLKQIEARIASAREELSYLTGRDLAQTPLLDEIASAPGVVPLEEALAQTKNRTDIRAQREETLARKYRIRYERGFFWPTADVTGKYYTRRATFMEDIQWDVMLGVDVPIFSGGSTVARVKEAKSAYQQSLYDLDDLERRIHSTVRKTHGELNGSVLETHSLEEAVDAAQKSYDALLKEYRLGLVTNLDVLQALDVLVVQRSALNAARLKTKMLFVQLNVAMEKMP